MRAISSDVAHAKTISAMPATTAAPTSHPPTSARSATTLDANERSPGRSLASSGTSRSHTA